MRRGGPPCKKALGALTGLGTTLELQQRIDRNALALFTETARGEERLMLVRECKGGRWVHRAARAKQQSPLACLVEIRQRGFFLWGRIDVDWGWNFGWFV
jgi:hypothetical protein